MIPRDVSGQSPGSSVLWQRPTLLVAGPGTSARVFALRAPDHRWEGMAIGAGVGAIAFGLLGAVACGQSESADNCTGMVVGTGLLGAFCGGILGGLIGGAIPKDDPADSTSASASRAKAEAELERRARPE